MGSNPYPVDSSHIEVADVDIMDGLFERLDVIEALNTPGRDYAGIVSRTPLQPDPTPTYRRTGEDDMDRYSTRE